MEKPKDATHYNNVNGLYYKLGVFGFVSVWSEWTQCWYETPHHIADYYDYEMEKLNENPQPCS